MRTPPDDLQEWAALYREARRPPAGLADRILAHNGDEESEPVVAQPDQRWGVGLAMGALIGIAALLALTWSMDAIHASQAATATPVEAPLQADPADDSGASAVPGEVPARDTSAVPRDPPPTLDAQPGAVTPGPALEPAAAPGPRPGPKADPTQPAEPTAAAKASSVDLESLRRLRAAEALLSREPAAARKALEQHARDYPRSPMMLEREALWIRAACASGITDGLQRRRKAFFQRADVSAYRDAIVRACDG